MLTLASSLSPFLCRRMNWLPKVHASASVSRIRLQPQRTSSVFTPFVENFVIIASNSYIGQGYSGSFELLSSTFLGPSATILLLNLGVRLVTLPLVVKAEKLLSQRIMTIAMVRKQVAEKIGKHYGIKTFLDMETGMWVLKTKKLGIANRAEELAHENASNLLLEKRLNIVRPISLRVCIYPVVFYSGLGLLNHVQASFGRSIPGFLWLDSLSQADPYMILPIFAGLLAFANIWASRWMYVSTNQNYKRTARYLDVVMVSFTICAVRLLLDAPAIMSIYWCTAIGCGLLQMLLIRHPKVKRLFRIGPLPTDSNTPFRDLFRRRILPPVTSL